MAEILWVQDEFDGPVNGVMKYNDDILWFSRVQLPFTESVKRVDDRTYILTKLDDETMKLVEEDHRNYCEQTGAPLKHGDPFKLRRKEVIEKPNIKDLIPNGDDSVELDKRSMLNVKVFTYRYDPANLCGKYITTIKESQITNYAVPRYSV